MDKVNYSSSPRVVGDQALEVDHTGLDSVAATPVSKRLDVLLLHDLPEQYSYRAIHDTVKLYGDVTRIRQIYDEDCPTNRCYVTFATAAEARLAFNAVDTFDIPGLRAEVTSSRNIADSEYDYVPNIFERTAEKASSEIHRAPTPRWFVAYYHNDRGNFIRASRFLQQEFGTFPRENVRRYGKGLLIKARDLTQAKMLHHFQGNQECIFDSIRPHKTFNYSRGIVFNYDLCEFTEEEIYAMCPPTVQKVWKVKGKGNMIVLTFFGTSLPDYIHIGPLRLRVKPFVDRPLQCYSCYEFGHSRKHCTETPRCGRCSILGTHSINECESRPYCYHCRSDHPLNSRDCPRYRLEQDVLNLANTNFISIGSARRELAYRRQETGEAKSYASSAGSRLQPKSTASSYESKIPLAKSPSSTGLSLVPIRNQFAVLDGTADDIPMISEESASAGSRPVIAVQTPRSPKRGNSNRAAFKRHHSLSDSAELLNVPPSKVSVGPFSSVRSADRASHASEINSARSLTRSSSLGSVLPDSLGTVTVTTQETLTPVGSDSRQVHPTPCDNSISDTSDCVEGTDSLPKQNFRCKNAASRPSSTTRTLTSPRAGAAGLSSARRITVPRQIGKGKGAPPTGTRKSHVLK